MCNNIFFLSTLVFLACSNDEKNNDEANNINIEELLYNKYKIKKGNNSNYDLTQITSKDKSFDLNNLNIYGIEGTKIQMIIIPSKTVKNKYTLIKGVANNGIFSIDKELECIIDLDKDGKSYFEIYNKTNNTGFSTVFENNRMFTGKKSACSTLCQQEGNEGFQHCFSREVAEFCSDFISTVAYATNPSISVLIAALCSC